MMEFFESLGVDMELSDMSFAVSLDKGRGCEWGSRNGLSGLFAQKRNALNPYFWQMIREIIKFKDDAIRQVTTLLCLYSESDISVDILIFVSFLVAVILICLRVTQIWITMSPWGSSSSQGVTRNYFRKHIL